MPDLKWNLGVAKLVSGGVAEPLSSSEFFPKSFGLVFGVAFEVLLPLAEETMDGRKGFMV